MADWPSIVADENSETGLVEHHRHRSRKSRVHRKSGKLEWPNKFPEDEKVAGPPLQGINLSFHNLSYSVKVGIRRETKQILRGVHGEFKAGDLTAIMGPSGAGKSSLMNALAGYTTIGVDGSVRVNGIDRDMRTFCRSSCYLLQDDVLPPMLTVQEAMAVAVKLKLGPGYPDSESRIRRILEALGLQRCRKVLASRLSGGQRKRLAIAMELVNDPPVMFFDEPTSGLDSSTSKQCISLLKELAQSGRNIICTIHQPSASLFELFDHVYVVAAGHCIYSGAAPSLVYFLADQSLHCPQYHNPADFLLEVASMEEYGCFVPKLTAAIEDGRSQNWCKISYKPCKLDPVPFEAKELLDNNEVSSISEETSSSSSCKIEGVCRARHTYAASFWTQFSTLIVRSFRQLYRNQFLTHLRIGIHAAVGLIIGVMFFDIGNRGSHARDNLSLIFFSIMFIMFTSYSSAVMYYPLELPILAREHFNKWYSLKSYYLASNLTEAPVQVFCTTLYFTIVYFFTSQPVELIRYFIGLGTVLLVSLVGQSFGYLIGSSMSITNAAICGPFVTAPFILFSGFFVLVTDAPWAFQWLFHISYFKYALHAALQSTYGFERPKLPCDLDYCHFRTPSAFLKNLGMDGGDFMVDWGVLTAIILLLRVLAYYSLVVQVRYLRK